MKPEDIDRILLVLGCPCLAALILTTLRSIFSERKEAVGRLTLFLVGLIFAVAIGLMQLWTWFVMDWLHPENHVGTLGYYFSRAAVIWHLTWMSWAVITLGGGLVCILSWVLSWIGGKRFVSIFAI